MVPIVRLSWAMRLIISDALMNQLSLNQLRANPNDGSEQVVF